jgi:hypothetical protein
MSETILQMQFMFLSKAGYELKNCFNKCAENTCGLISLDSTRATGVAGTTSCWWITLVVKLAPGCKNICQPWLKHALYSSFHRSWMITAISCSECEYCCTVFDMLFCKSSLVATEDKKLKPKNFKPAFVLCTLHIVLFAAHFVLLKYFVS